MEKQEDKLSTFIWRITAVHMITYFIIGLISAEVFNYEAIFSSDNLGLLMKSTNEPIVALGPTLQVVRGLIFSVVLWPFRTTFLNKKAGWLQLWFLFIGLSILSTFGPALGSVDGMIYTTIPIKKQLLLLPELLIQSCLLSFCLYYWYQQPKKSYNVIALIISLLILFMGIAGYISLKS